MMQTMPTQAEERPAATKVAYAYYPGCSLHSTAREYDVSTKLVCQALGIELKELKGWTCCGASAAHSTDHFLSLALPAHTLKLAQEVDLPVAVPCAMCFSRLKFTVHALADGKMRERVERAIGSSLEKIVAVKSLLEVLDFDVPEGGLKKSLEGLKVACYYGCLLVRPREVVNLDDENNPQIMDRIVGRLGAESLPWGLKTECCGASLSLPRRDMVGKMTYRLLSLAKRLGADCVAVACPMCHFNLDSQQKRIESEYGTKLGLPVVFFTQLMGLALGISPDKLLFKKHFIDPRPVLTTKGLI